MFLKPIPPPYDPLEWAKKPFTEKGAMVCNSWAMQGYGTPLAVYLLYLLKIALYVSGWFFFCSFTPGMGHLSNVASWWLRPEAFQKAILWSMLFEITGLGCGSGPLTGRYLPPIGGLLYFLRPGTTKLPVFEGAPLIGGYRRTWLDVLLYAATLALTFTALISSQSAVRAPPPDRDPPPRPRPPRQDALPRRARRALLDDHHGVRPRREQRPTSSPARRPSTPRSGSGRASRRSITTSRPSSA